MSEVLLTNDEAQALNQSLEADFQNHGLVLKSYQALNLADLDFSISDQCDQLFSALAAASAEIGATVTMTGRNSRFKTADNQFQGSLYATLDDAVKASKVILGRHGLALMMPPTGGPQAGAYFIQCLLVHSSGQWIKSRYQLPVDVKSDSQTISSANTYGKRIVTLGMLNMALGDGEDDDGNSETPPSNDSGRQSFYQDSGAPRVDDAPPPSDPPPSEGPPPKPELKGGYDGELPTSKAQILGKIKNISSMSDLQAVKNMANDMVRMGYLDREKHVPEVSNKIKVAEENLQKSMKVDSSGLAAAPITQE
jgi:hypothetical protein